MEKEISDGGGGGGTVPARGSISAVPGIYPEERGSEDDKQSVTEDENRPACVRRPAFIGHAHCVKR